MVALIVIGSILAFFILIGLIAVGVDAGYEDEEQKETIEFKIYLYKLSKEMYTYLKSLNRINNNDLGGYGLAPIRSHYTNVENGIGLLGGCNVYESEWISNPKE